MGEFDEQRRPDPESALRELARLVRPGGVIAFCETDIGAVS
ncbi:MAG TPA: hypothetical protein VN255_09785 [Mycobacterium sp.]|nr:hypothetical protein [Mycobacterium sp.]HWT48842.1 hypothetical protein [Mycobacterium sp.]